MSGDRAVSSVKRDLKNAVFYPTKLTGRLNEEIFSFEKQFNFAKMKLNQEGRVVINVNCNGENREIYAEQVLAALFTEVIELLSLNGINERSAVVTVPAFASQSSRQAIIDAAFIAGIKILKLIHESSAVVTDYGIFRRADLETDKPRVVAFFDIGYSKSSIFVANIWRDRADILFEAAAPQTGIRNIDLKLLDYHI